MEEEDAGRADNYMKKNTEIDTSAPFGSVKEAVAMFGERVVAGDGCNASRLQQLNKSREDVDHVTSKLNTMTVELEETKQNLQNLQKKATDEGVLMAACLFTLQKELEQTKCELQQLKQKDQYSSDQSISVMKEDNKGKEDVKHVDQDGIKVKEKPEIKNYEKELEFQKNHVNFAHEPSATKFTEPQGDLVLKRHPSLRKKKKKPLIPLIGGVFSWKKGSKRI